MVPKYIVGTLPCTLNDISGEEKRNHPFFASYIIPIYYRDTRKELGYSEFSNYFTSSSDPMEATKHDTYEEAVAWEANNLHGEGVVYRVG